MNNDRNKNDKNNINDNHDNDDIIIATLIRDATFNSGFS